MQTLVPNVRKLAVLRANAVGDFVVVLPALHALRSAYPNAEIVLLGAPWHAPFLAGRPGPIDRVGVVPPTEGVREEPGARHDHAAETRAFFAAMAAERFDLAFQLHGGGRYSNPLVLGLGARLTIGLKAPDAPPLDRWIPYLYYQPEVLRYLEVVALAGAARAGIEPRLEVTNADLSESLAVVAEDERPLVTLHPGATDPRRRWPAERFAAVGDALAREGARVLVTGTVAERDVVDGVVRRMREPAQPVAGLLSLGGLVGLLARSALVVSNDTGPRHLAEAVGSPTVAIYWCGNLINAGPMTRALHRPLVSWTISCPICGISSTGEPWPARTGGKRCPHDPSFVDAVAVEDVLEHALDLLRGRDAGRARPAPPGPAPAAVPSPNALGAAPPERVAVFRALHLGDLLCAVPALRALRAALPGAEITLIGLPWAREFVTRFDRYLDAFLEFPGYPGLPEREVDLAEVPPFLDQARRRRFDLALQLHGSGTVTNPLVSLLGARRTAGFFRPGEYRPDDALSLPSPEREPEVRRLLRLLELLGIRAQGEELEFPLREEDREELEGIPGARSLASGDYVCVHPGARASERRWPAVHFAAVADSLARLGLRPVLTGSAAETNVAAEVAAAMREPPLDLSGRTSLGGLAALLSRARLVVCNDTAVSHLAAALRVPSVVVFTASEPERWAPLDRSLHRVAAGRAAFAARGGVAPDRAWGGVVGVPVVVAEAEELLRRERIAS